MLLLARVLAREFSKKTLSQRGSFITDKIALKTWCKQSRRKNCRRKNCRRKNCRRRREKNLLCVFLRCELCAQRCEARRSAVKSKKSARAHTWPPTRTKSVIIPGGRAEKDPAHSYGQVRPYTLTGGRRAYIRMFCTRIFSSFADSSLHIHMLLCN